jgi:hypothetical protein
VGRAATSWTAITPTCCSSSSNTVRGAAGEHTAVLQRHARGDIADGRGEALAEGGHLAPCPSDRLLGDGEPGPKDRHAQAQGGQTSPAALLLLIIVGWARRHHRHSLRHLPVFYRHCLC